MSWRTNLVLAITVTALSGQTVSLEPAEPAAFAAPVDSNSPAYWQDGHRYLYHSTDVPVRVTDGDPDSATPVEVDGDDIHRWIESVWRSDQGSIYAWYHTEPDGVCPGLPLTAPEIGAMVSDDGIHFTDLGIVLQSGDQPACATANRYFAGGHGDFTVIPDANGMYFYFVFTNYGGPVSSQGIAMARMSVASLANPVGAVWKFDQGYFNSPGLGGSVSPVIPVRGDWSSDAPDAFWGPSVHWNRALRQYVVLLNHAINPDWDSDGVFIAFNPDLANPLAWTPARLLTPLARWYPQVLGDGPDDTDSLAGNSARLYLMGGSAWTLTFDLGAHVSPMIKSDAQLFDCGNCGRRRRH